MNTSINLKNMDKNTIDEIETYLMSLSDDAKREWIGKIAHTSYRVLGGTIPAMREIARRIVKSGYADLFLEIVPCDSYEMVMLNGLVLAYDSQDETKCLDRLDSFLYESDCWAHIDTVVATIKYRDETYYRYLVHHLHHDNEWHIRYGIVGLMWNYMRTKKRQEYAVSLLDILHLILSVDAHTYYIDMAIAWAISEAYIIGGEEILSYLIDTNISDDITRYAVQKVKDSYRVSREDKMRFIEAMHTKK